MNLIPTTHLSGEICGDRTNGSTGILTVLLVGPSCSKTMGFWNRLMTD